MRCADTPTLSPGAEAEVEVEVEGATSAPEPSDPLPMTDPDLVPHVGAEVGEETDAGEVDTLVEGVACIDKITTRYI